MTGWRLDWVLDWKGADEGLFREAWEGLLRESPNANVFHRPGLVLAWAETCARENEIRPAFILGTDGEGGRVLLLSVLVEYRGRLMRRTVLEPAGQALFGTHAPLFTGPVSDWAGFWMAVRTQAARWADQAVFRFVPAAQAPSSADRCADESPTLELEGISDLEALLSRCSSNHRGDVRRRLRRLAECGAIELWVASPGEAAEAAREFEAHHAPALAAAGEQRGFDPLLAARGVKAFVGKLLDAGIRSGWVHYSALRVGGRSVAWHLGFVDRGELYWWLPAHDRDFESYSPGKALLALLLEDAIRKRISRFHFQTGSQPYKLAWNPRLPDIRTLRWYSPGVKGRALELYDRSFRERRSSAA